MVITKRGLATGFDPAPDIGGLIAIGVPGDPRHPEGHSAVLVVAAETATVAPGGVLMSVVRPGHRPVVAAHGLPPVGRPVKFDVVDDRARRVGRHIGGCL